MLGLLTAPLKTWPRKDLFALAVVVVGCVAILVNALFLQTGPHPAPIFANAAPPPPTPAPSVPVKSAALTPARPAAAPEAAVPVKVALPRPRPSAATPATRVDPLADLIAPPAGRVAAVQRALSEWGYGQIKPTGTLDTATQTAIEKFERARRLPVTGQVSERVVREISLVSGRPVE